MVKTAAEYQRDYRRRKSEQQQEAKELTRTVTKVPFHEYAAENPNWRSAEMALDIAGIELPAFDDDRSPASASGEIERGSPEIYNQFPGAIGRAEILFNSLLDAATDVASVINAYKREAVDRAIDEYRSQPISDPARQGEIMDETIRLGKIRDQLDRRSRRTFPAIEVKEI